MTYNLFPKELEKFFVGFEPMVQKFSNVAEQAAKIASNYPPYNIKKIDDNKYLIEMAVAGFGKQDLEVELAGDKLIIKGNIQSGEDAEKDSTDEWTWPVVVYQGLAMRPFTRTFNIADNVEIRGAELLNGILKIALESIIPDEKTPTKIEIKDTKGK